MNIVSIICSLLFPGLGQLIKRRWAIGISFILATVSWIVLYRMMYTLRGDIKTTINTYFIIAGIIIWSLNVIDIINGKTLKKAPCTKACPANIDIPGFLYFTGQRNFKNANRLILKKIPFPGILGRVCYAPCEDVCTRKRIDGKAVNIKVVKRADYDYGFVKLTPSINFRKRIAIVGAGPAAFYLGLEGFKIDIYDKEDKPGGMMRYGIPEFRLPNAIIDKETYFLHEWDNVAFKGNEYIDQERLEKLTQEYDAVILSTGAQIDIYPGIEGEKLDNVFHGLLFLKNVNTKKITALNGKIAVIGGGNVAIDVARSALRLGAEPYIFYRREKIHMPADPEEIKLLEDEGISIKELLSPKKITKENNHLHVKFDRIELEHKHKGRTSKLLRTGKEETGIFSYVIFAIGQKRNEFFSSLIKKGFKSKIKNVYIGGDLLRGSSTVVEAVADGRKIAEKLIRKFSSPAKLVLNWIKRENTYILRPMHINYSTRYQEDYLDKKKRLGTFEEVDMGFREDTAVKCSHRCIGCPVRDFTKKMRRNVKQNT